MTDTFAIRHRAIAVLLELAEDQNAETFERIQAVEAILADEQAHRSMDLEAQTQAQLEANEAALDANREAAEELREALESKG